MNETLRTSIADKFRNTPLGFLRIRRNLGIISFSDRETEIFLRKIIMSTPLENIAKGKNHYFKCFEYKAILTVNAHSFTVITAKKIVSRAANRPNR